MCTRTVLAVAAAIGAAAFAGCGKEADTASQPRDIPSDAVAKVGQHVIGKAEFQRYFAFDGGISSNGPDAEQRIVRRALDRLVIMVVLREEAEKRGISVPERDAQEMVNTIKKSWGKRYRRGIRSYTDSDFKRILVNGKLLELLTKDMSDEGPLPRWMTTGNAKDLPQHWKAQIVCREGYVSGACDG